MILHLGLITVVFMFSKLSCLCILTFDLWTLYLIWVIVFFFIWGKKCKFLKNDFLLFHNEIVFSLESSEWIGFFSSCIPSKTQGTGDIVISNAYVDLVPKSDTLDKTPSEVGYQCWYPSHFLISEFQLSLLEECLGYFINLRTMKDS